MLIVFDKLNNTLVLVGKVKLNCNLVVFVDIYSINQFWLLSSAAEMNLAQPQNVRLLLF